MKPAAIKKFDFLYIGSMVVSVLGAVLSFDDLVAISDDQLATEGLPAMGSGVLLIGLAFTIVITLALWFLVSKLRIEFVKYILALFAAYSIFSVAMGSSAEVPMTNLLIGWVSTIMSVAAVYFLFTPEAKAWFAEKRGSGD
ncbi:hypothetical protein GRI34_10545 [Erythrobacter aquimaris]|uniref:Uncharacterized protein n=1 Tax=Qipengyuania aquimaris TaxID=255984 RepID=A0A6I4TLM0_9SPHN|nr:hypothetical protein [Qipengyuania aquimaris]MXO96852.1 hypothetical protein [Qipengyuania aquimaris]